MSFFENFIKESRKARAEQIISNSIITAQTEKYTSEPEINWTEQTDQELSNGQIEFYEDDIVKSKLLKIKQACEEADYDNRVYDADQERIENEMIASGEY